MPRECASDNDIRQQGPDQPHKRYDLHFDEECKFLNDGTTYSSPNSSN